MSTHTADPSGHRFTNRLAEEKSPYLRQHAHNPVDWYPWSEEALTRAKREDKPIFLSIGYSACHWCHVMERESFESEDIAALVNRYFVAIKVDREERPDIDEIYMTAVQRMTGSGGWPLSLFLLPDGRPFYGGTYFPPTNRYGRIGFPSLVEQLGDAYANRRDEILDVAASIGEEMQAASRQRPLAESGPVNPARLLTAAVADLNERLDAEHGGFGGAPKFPPHHALRLLLTAVRDGHEAARSPLTLTLDKMALGGIYDHIGGGFHRYATDAIWLLPHFEKMLYDNALLLRVYAEASELLDSPAYARIARETADWVIRDLIDPATGGIEAALDADSEGEEGKYYLWTRIELGKILGASAGIQLGEMYNFETHGNFSHEVAGHPISTNIPYLSVSGSPFPLPEKLPEAMLSAREKLLAHRYQRVPPGKDDKIITAWNGLMIGALAFAGKALGERRYLDAARRAATFCLTTLRPNGELLRRYAKGEAAIPAFLDDYAYLADGLLDLAEATGEPVWIAQAHSLVDTLLDRFWDDEDGGFFYTGSEHETLVAQTKDLFDGALPSANGVAARVLARLGKLPHGGRCSDRARAMLESYHGLLTRVPQATATMILAAREQFGDATYSSPQEIAALAADAETISLAPGESTVAVFTLRVAPGYHVNSNTAGGDAIATTATIHTDVPAAVGPVRYPDAVDWDDGAGETLPVYVGAARFRVPITVAEDALPGVYSVALSVRAQACSATECLAPADSTAVTQIRIAVPTAAE